jgi:DNA-binding GntR family transcriptional regulator
MTTSPPESSDPGWVIMAGEIRALIHEGRLEPGTRLSVSGAAFWWFTSRWTAIRAFRSLMNDGLVKWCLICRCFYVAEPGS